MGPLIETTLNVVLSIVARMLFSSVLALVETNSTRPLFTSTVA